MVVLPSHMAGALLQLHIKTSVGDSKYRNSDQVYLSEGYHDDLGTQKKIAKFGQEGDL